MQVTRRIELKDIQCSPLICFGSQFKAKKLMCLYDTNLEPYFFLSFYKRLDGVNYHFLSYMRHKALQAFIDNLIEAERQGLNSVKAQDFTLIRSQNGTTWKKLAIELREFFKGG